MSQGVPVRIVLLLAGLLLPRGAAQQLPPLFGGPMSPVEAMQQPQFLAVGDVTGDGLPDALSWSPFPDVVTVAHGTGDGRFVPGEQLPVTQDLLVVRIADVEGDGDADIVTRNRNIGLGKLNTILSDGAGGFLPTLISPGSSLTGDLALADLDGDGDIDALETQFSVDNMLVLLGDGLGAFTPGPLKAAGDQPTDIVLADLDLDGDLDAGLATNAQHAIVVLRGTGDASFFEAPLFFGVGKAVTAIASGDFDGNGQPDLAGAVMATDTARFVWSQPGGVLQAGSAVTLGLGANAVGLAAGDCDEDGLDDLLASGLQAVTMLAADGHGGFLPPQSSGAVRATEPLELSDVNGDGHLDVVLAHEASSFSVILGDGNGVPRANQQLALPGGQNGLVLRDFDADGLADLAVASTNPHELDVLLGAGGGEFGNLHVLPLEVYPSALVDADFDEDGVADLAVACETPGVQVLVGDGAGDFTAKPSVPTGALPSGLVIADFDLDGHADTGTADSTGQSVSILLGAGDGTLAPAARMSFGGAVIAIASADFDLDGVPDLVVSQGVRRLLLGVGDGSFTAGVLPTWTGGYALAAADLDGNGAADIVGTLSASALGDKQVVIQLGAGDGSFEQWKAGTFAYPVNTLTVADLDGDDVPDLVAPGCASVGALSVLTGVGDGSFVSQGGYASGESGAACAVADLDDDGTLDVVSSHKGAFDSLTVLLNRRGGPAFPWTDLGHGLPGLGEPRLTGTGTLLAGTPGALTLSDAPPSAAALLFLALAGGSVPFKGGTIVAWPALVAVPLATPAASDLVLPWAAWPAGASGLELALQMAIADGAAPKGVSLSNGLRALVP